VCNNEEFYTKQRGTQTGLYCSSCHAWIKWISKKDLKTFNESGYVAAKPQPQKKGSKRTLKDGIISYIHYLEVQGGYEDVMRDLTRIVEEYQQEDE
jgi:hypothetical protein